MAKNCRMEFNWIEARNVAKRTILRCSPGIEKDLLEDIVQDSVERALLKLSKFEAKKGSFNAWMATIARNVFIDFTRKEGKHVFVNYELIESTFSDTEDYLFLEERAIALLDAIECLKIKDKTLVKLRYFDNLSFEEIEFQTGIPRKNVPVYIMRAKEELKKSPNLFQKLFAA